VKIDKCPENPAELCGEIVEVFNADYTAKTLTLKLPAPNGNFLFWGVKPHSENHWRNGKVWNPFEDDKTYDAWLTLVSENKARIDGCVFWVCSKGQNWSRVK
jgi:uncharacterized protein (DUF2147 family)